MTTGTASIDAIRRRLSSSSPNLLTLSSGIQQPRLIRPPGTPVDSGFGTGPAQPSSSFATSSQPPPSGSPPPPPPSSGPTGMYGQTHIYGSGGPSPVTGANIGLSEWGRPLTGQLRPEQYAQVLSQNPQVTAAIRAAATQRYGSENQEQVVGLVNKVVNEGMPLQQALQMLNGGYQISDPLLQRAADLVGMQYDPQQQQLQHSLDMLGIFENRDISTQQNYGHEGDTRLQSIYDALNSQLQGGLSSTSALYNQGRQQVTDAYQGAQQTAAGAGGAVRDQLIADMQRLGLQQAAPDPLNSLESQLGVIQAQGAQQQAGATANMAQLGTAMQGVAQGQIGDARQEGAQRRSNLVRDVQSAITGAQSDYGAQQGDILTQLNSLSGQRSADLRTTLTGLQQAQSEQARQSMLDSLAAEIQRGTLDLQRQELGMNQQDQSFNHQMAQLQYDLQKQQLQAQLSQTTDPLEQQKIQAEIDHLNAQTFATLNPQASGGNPTNAQRNMSAVDQLLSSPSQWWGPGGAGPQFRQGFQDLVSQAFTQASNRQALPTGGYAPAIDPFQWAMSAASTGGPNGSLNPQALQAALRAYFGR